MFAAIGKLKNANGVVAVQAVVELIDFGTQITSVPSGQVLNVTSEGLYVFNSSLNQ
jgi:hypothetical protein